MKGIRKKRYARKMAVEDKRLGGAELVSGRPR